MTETLDISNVTKRGPLTEAERIRARELCAEGYSDTMIAVQLGLGPQGKDKIAGVRKRANPPWPKPSIVEHCSNRTVWRKPRRTRWDPPREPPKPAAILAHPVERRAAPQSRPVPRPAPEVAPMVGEPTEAPVSRRLTLIELQDNTCRFPLGDPHSPDFRYCGSPTLGTGPYCGHHHKVAFQTVQDRRRERDQARRLMLQRRKA